MRKKKLALIGLGKQGREHLDVQHLCQYGEIIAAYDPHPPTELKFDLPCYQKIEELPFDQLDGLIIAIPHDKYVELLKDIWRIKPGLAIAKEKPLGRSLVEANQILAMAEACNAPLQVFIQRRFHQTYQHLKQLMSGLGGSPDAISLTMSLGFQRPENKSDAKNWRTSRSIAGGGALIDSGYHLIDLAMYLIGDFEPLACTLWADHHLITGDEVDDAAFLVGNSNKTAINITSRTYQDNAEGINCFPKQEEVLVHYPSFTLVANRESVKKVYAFNTPESEVESLIKSDKSWQAALVKQIDDFCLSLDKPNFQYDRAIIWDQYPAQAIIEWGYEQVKLWDSSPSTYKAP